MKTIQILFLALFFSASMAMAQDTLYVYKAGAVAYKSVISTVDSITFQKIYPPAPTVTDFDGNVYHTVVIGTQTWMAEDLKTTHYRDGSAITNVTDNGAWVANTSGAWCDYNNDPAMGTKYGHLYNWYAVSNASNLAPAGWHVPTFAEWTILANYLGGDAFAGGKLKETGTVNWTAPNYGATNETGFTSRPGGYRSNSDGTFGIINGYVNIWGSDAADASRGYYVYMQFDNTYLNRGAYFKGCGFTVRCIKD